MNCIKCGAELPDTCSFCPNCGEKIIRNNEPSDSTAIMPSPVDPTATNEPKNLANQSANGYAIAGFSLGLTSIELGFFFLIPILGIIFSAKGSHSSHPRLASTGLKLSITFLTIWALLLQVIILLVFLLNNHRV